MARGITFKIPNAYGRFLSIIFAPVSPDAYQWSVRDTEAYCVQNGKLDIPLFAADGAVPADEMKKALGQPRCYLIFADIRAYDGQIPEHAEETFEEYEAGNCILTLFVTDCMWAELYCKDADLLQKIYQNVKAVGFDDVEWLTQANDFRTRFSVW